MKNAPNRSVLGVARAVRSGTMVPPIIHSEFYILHSLSYRSIQALCQGP
jgi:hypothetical protein